MRNKLNLICAYTLQRAKLYRVLLEKKSIFNANTYQDYKYFLKFSDRKGIHFGINWEIPIQLAKSIWKYHIRLLIPRWETRNEEFENKEFLARKTDEKNEKMRDQKSSILKAFRGGNYRKFKIMFSYLAQSTLKWFLSSKIWLI